MQDRQNTFRTKIFTFPPMQNIFAILLQPSRMLSMNSSWYGSLNLLSTSGIVSLYVNKKTFLYTFLFCIHAILKIYPTFCQYIAFFYQDYLKHVRVWDWVFLKTWIIWSCAKLLDCQRYLIAKRGQKLVKRPF